MPRLAPFAVAAAMLFAAGPAAAATTLGGTLTATAEVQNCPTTCSAIQFSLPAPSGNRAAPSRGVITGWRANGSAQGVIFAADVNPATGSATLRAASGPGFVAAGAPLNAVRVPIQTGQFAGITLVGGGAIGFSPADPSTLFNAYGPLTPGVPGPPDFPPPGAPTAVAYEATVEPDADGDGFGDETQDKCPAQATPAAPGGSCPVANQPPALTAKPKVRTVRQGAKSIVAFGISEAATLKATIERKAKGRKVGKKCKAPTRKNRERKSCTRYTGKRTLTLKAKAGANKLSLGKRKAGTYRLTIVATDGLGAKAAAVKTTFKVKPKKKRRR